MGLTTRNLESGQSSEFTEVKRRTLRTSNSCPNLGIGQLGFRKAGCRNYIISYHIVPYHIISYHIISYHIVPYHIVPYHIISYHIISYHIVPYHIISCHIISYITSYHIVPRTQRESNLYTVGSIISMNDVGVALTFEEMRTPYAGGREICVQKFGNAYQRKE